MPAEHVLAVSTPSRSYNVTIGRDLFLRLGEIVRAALGPGPKKAAIIADTNVPASLLSAADVSLSRAGFFIARIGIEATEERKSIRELEGVLAFLASMKLERTEPVIAIGGGIVGDLAGFAAAIHRRGCPVVQCPTTLLAMVDASIGGKTGVNLGIHAGGGTLLKNAVGAFHQPHAVVASLDALDSLPPRQFGAGLAECVKHALLGGEFGEATLLEWMEEGIQRSSEGARQGSSSLPDLIARNITLKSRVLANDEREEAPPATGGRALLNLGHTFAHAIETLPGLAFTTVEGPTASPLLHGEAVALGLVAACHASAAMKMCEPTLPARVSALLTSLNQPVRVQGLPDAGTVLARMTHDKKVAGGKLRLVLPTTPRGGGTRAEVIEDPPTPIVLAAINSIRDLGHGAADSA